MIWFTLIYLLSSAASLVLLFSEFQGESPCFAGEDYWKDIRYSAFLALFGPASLFVALCIRLLKFELNFK